jgi:hypothetical protein
MARPSATLAQMRAPADYKKNRTKSTSTDKIRGFQDGPRN